MAVRVGSLLFYLMGAFVLNRYLQKRLPTSSNLPTAPGNEPWKTLFWVWGPTLWIFPGLLWVRLLDFSPMNFPPIDEPLLDLSSLLVPALSFLLPLCCLSLFLLVSGVFTSYGQSVSGSTLALLTFSILSFTAITLISALTHIRSSYAKLGLFCLSSMMPTLISIWLLILFAPTVAPTDDTVDTPLRSSLALILGFFSTIPKTTWFVEDGKIQTRIEGNDFQGIGPGLLVTEPENVVVLKMGAQITRVAGPGVVLTNKGEVPYRVVDLRNQIRSSRVNAITREGIEVRVPISSAFRIQRGNRKISLGKPWPYRTQRDVLQALFAEEVDPSGRSPLDAHTAHPWEDIPIKLSAHKLEQAISLYSLDQLYSGIKDPAATRITQNPQNELLKTHRLVESSLGLSKDGQLGDLLCRHTVGKIVRRSVKQALVPRGFEIIGGGVGSEIEPVSRTITEHRIEAWKSRFITKVMDWHANIELKRFAALTRIRQAADAQMISGLIAETGKRLQDADGTAKRELVAYHVLDCLIGIARSPKVEHLLPESALPALEKVLKKVAGDTDTGERP